MLKTFLTKIIFLYKIYLLFNIMVLSERIENRIEKLDEIALEKLIGETIISECEYINKDLIKKSCANIITNCT